MGMYITGIILGIGFSILDLTLLKAETRKQTWNKPIYYVITVVFYIVAMILSFYAKYNGQDEIAFTLTIGLGIRGIVNQITQKKLIEKLKDKLNKINK